MKRINAAKAVLDLFLTIGFLLLMEPKATGLSLHERGGLGICLFFLAHKLLNWRWIRAVTASFFNTRLSARARLGYVVDLLLLAGISIIMISGMGMSKTLDFSWLLSSSPGWKGLHATASLLILLAIGLHVGLHARWISERAREASASLRCPERAGAVAIDGRSAK